MQLAHTFLEAEEPSLFHASPDSLLESLLEKYRETVARNYGRMLGPSVAGGSRVKRPLIRRELFNFFGHGRAEESEA